MKNFSAMFHGRFSAFSQRFLCFLGNRSLLAVIIVSAYIMVAPFLPLIVHRFLYTVSFLIKDILVWMMPLTVCFFIAQTVVSFERKAPLLIVTLLIFETLSNFSSVWYAFSIAGLTAGKMPGLGAVLLDGRLDVLWRIPFVQPSWWGADKGCIAGMVLGSIAGIYNNVPLKNRIFYFRSCLEWVLVNIFSRFVPLFILGFVANMYHTRMIQRVTGEYGLLLLWLFLALSVYILFLFALGAGGRPGLIRRHVSNLLPAGAIALTTGCSLSTMPWTIQGAGKNLKHPEMAQAIIPATTNIQQVGDCIVNAFLCFVIYTHFHGNPPSITTLLVFSMAFVFARFATAAVLGGAIFVMLPVYEACLDFTPEMIAIILAMNVVLDPFVTSSNVMANGALCRLFEMVWGHVHGLFRWRIAPGRPRH